MGFDGVAVAAVVAEAVLLLPQARVNKVQQPGALDLLFTLYTRSGQVRLVLAASPAWARVHLTRAEFKNPPQPPAFCMRLRRLLEGARVMSVRQVQRDRIVHVEFGSRDELGNPITYTLVAEVMGKRSNLLLLGPDGRILDAIRRVTEATNRHREILPGLRYIPPPSAGKADPAQVRGNDLAARAAEMPGKTVAEVVLATVDGIGPLQARDLARGENCDGAAKALGDTEWEHLASACRALAARVDRGDFAPHLLWDATGQLVDFTALAPAGWPGRSEPQPSMSAALDRFYAYRQEHERRHVLRTSLERAVRTALDRAHRRRELQAADVARAENAEGLRECGELLMAQLGAVPRGADKVAMPDFYRADGGTRDVVLDPSLTPAQNAQAYFRRYQKARASQSVAAARLAETQTELLYLEQVEVSLTEAEALPELAEIQRELEEQGYLRGTGGGARGGGAAKERTLPARPLVVQSTAGLEIWVGRNNRQNDVLTLKLAHPTDLWFHTKDIAGAHVILRIPPGGEVPETSLLEAAVLAAYHSRARGSAQVPVDYTLRKHVRKPAGARPGLVTYDHHRTLYVTPDPEQHPILRAVQSAAPDPGTSEPAAPAD